MSECVTLVSCYVLRRKKRASASNENDTRTAYGYQVWVVAQVCCGPDAASIPAFVAKVAEGDSAAAIRRIRKAVADVEADRTMAAFWRSANLTRQQALDLVADLPDTLRELAGTSLGSLAGVAGVPIPVAMSGGEITSAFLLEPVLEPVTWMLHGLEVAGIVIGLAIGQPHLSILCAKHLLHDEVGSGLATVFERTMRPAEAVSDDSDSATDSATGDAQSPKTILSGSWRAPAQGPAAKDGAVSSHKPSGPAASALS